MDYRYETKDESRDFHKSRLAFVIIDKKIWPYEYSYGIINENYEIF